MQNRYQQSQLYLFCWTLCLVTLLACSPSAPQILKQPQGLTARAGEAVTLSVTARGSGPLTYSWYFEREPVPEETHSMLRFDPIREEDAGLYWAVISNKWGRVGSDGVLLRVASGKEWTEASGGNGHRYEFVRSGERENGWQAMIKDVQASGGYLVSLHSEAEETFVNTLAPLHITRLLGLMQPPGSLEPAEGWHWMSGEPFTYSHWGRREPNNGGGVNHRGFENLVGLSGDGSWNDIHGGGKAYIVEYPKRLVIYADLTNSVVSSYDSVALRAGAASTKALHFHWFANGGVLQGVTQNVLEVTTALKHPGPYFFTVSDGAMTLTSAVAQVQFGPLLTSAPKTTALRVGETARFEVSVTGPGPVSFQWYRNKTLLPGETNGSLLLTNITAAQSGSYWVEVANAYATARSAPGALVVVAPQSHLILLDDFECSTHPGWSLPVTTVPPIGGQRFLGEFGHEAVSLTLTNLPVHEQIEVAYDVIIRGYWQGNHRPDIWSIRGDGMTLLDTTFSTFTTQAFPGAYPDAENLRATDALETNTLGYELSFADNQMLEDARFRIVARGVHTNRTIVLTFDADLGNSAEAGWSLDNVAVVAKE